ncbi:hypothetical protein D9M70_512390 [compost metagenome]
MASPNQPPLNATRAKYSCVLNGADSPAAARSRCRMAVCLSPSASAARPRIASSSGKSTWVSSAISVRSITSLWLPARSAARTPRRIARSNARCARTPARASGLSRRCAQIRSAASRRRPSSNAREPSSAHADDCDSSHAEISSCSLFARPQDTASAAAAMMLPRHEASLTSSRASASASAGDSDASARSPARSPAISRSRHSTAKPRPYAGIVARTSWTHRMAASMSPLACSSESTVSAASTATASSGDEMRNSCFQLPRASST